MSAALEDVTRRKPQPSAEQQAARPGLQIAGVRYSTGIA
jgi:hypothetical protein